APQRQRVPRIPRDGHANEVAIAYDAVGGVEVDPSGSRQVRLHPAVRRSSTDSGGSVQLGNEDITTDKASGNTERPNGFHHEHREVPAAAALAPKRLARTLDALLAALQILELLLDA